MLRIDNILVPLKAQTIMNKIMNKAIHFREEITKCFNPSDRVLYIKQ